MAGIQNPAYSFGVAYSKGDCVVSMLGNPNVIGFVSLNYNEKQDKPLIYGAGVSPVATGFGKKSAEGTLVLLMEEVKSIQAAAGGSLLNLPPFSILVTYASTNVGKITTDRINNVQFTENPREIGEDAMSINVSLPFTCSGIDYNI